MSQAHLTREALDNLQKLEVVGRDGPYQKRVLIVWDIENAKVPVGVPVMEVEKAISNAFLYKQRRQQEAFCCSLSRPSLGALEKASGWDGVDYLLRRTKVVLAAGDGKSGSTDVKLILEIDAFVSRQAHDHKGASSVLVVITGDDDYSVAISKAMNAGMDVEVLHPTDRTSAKLLGLIQGRPNCWHHDWLEFLEYWLRKHSDYPKLPSPLRMPIVGGNDGQGSRSPQPNRQGGVGRQRQQEEQQQQQQQQRPRQQQQQQQRPRQHEEQQQQQQRPREQEEQQQQQQRPRQSNPQQQRRGERDAAARKAPAQEGAPAAAGSAAAQERKRAGVQAAVASLCLAELPLVRGCSETERSLVHLREWLLDGIVPDAGCELKLAYKPDDGGKILITCSSPSPSPDDLDRAKRTVLRARNQVRGLVVGQLLSLPDLMARYRASNGCGSGGHGGGASSSQSPLAAAYAARLPAAVLDRLRSAYPTARLSDAQLRAFLSEKGLESAAAAGTYGELVHLANLVLLVEAELGLPYSTLAGGDQILVPVGSPPAGVTPAAEKEAVRGFLQRGLSVKELKEKLWVRGVQSGGLLEKKDLAEALCGTLMLWEVETRTA